MSQADDARYLVAGFWLVRCCERCPLTPARIYFADSEGGNPENHMPDRPYWQGELGGKPYDPFRIMGMLEFLLATPAERSRMRNPPLAPPLPGVTNRRPRLMTAPMAKWKQDRARVISEADYNYRVAVIRWAKQHAPDDPAALDPTKPVDPHHAQTPF
jgi:hypothetical protein